MSTHYIFSLFAPIDRRGEFVKKYPTRYVVPVSNSKLYLFFCHGYKYNILKIDRPPWGEEFFVLRSICDRIWVTPLFKYCIVILNQMHFHNI